jgi:hypothetical protein
MVKNCAKMMDLAFAATTAFFIMPPTRRLTDRIVALIDGRR